MHSRVIEDHKCSLALSKQQRDTLVGILLGDACLETRNQGRTYRVKVEQSAEHESYVRHLHALFGPWVLSPPHQRRCKASNGSDCSSWAFSTVSHGAFRFYAQQFYAGAKKQVPALIHRWLTPRGLAYWFMDDGSMKSSQSKGVIFNTQGFPYPDVQRLVGVLSQKFRLGASMRHQSDGWQIYVSGKSFTDFLELVGAYVIQPMRYKLPQPRRTRLPK
jgi:hypothetical protein